MVDVRCRNERIVELGQDLIPATEDTVILADQHRILPGLIDHHIHLLATAAARSSVKCGPPNVRNQDELREALRTAAGEFWVRGVGYHESVAGDLQRELLDQLCPSRPLRIQHRSGKMWYLNSIALAELGLDSNAAGQLFRQDEIFKAHPALQTDFRHELQLLSDELASYGITQVTDATPSNTDEIGEYLKANMVNQRVEVMGDISMAKGWHKIMLDEVSLPPLDQLSKRIHTAHEKGRAVAIHCVTRTELVYALAAIEEAGPMAGDRIEHASVSSEDTWEWMARLGVGVVTQPNFLFERGDAYLVDVPKEEHDSLYCMRSLLEEGISVAASTDAPFGSHNPWIGLQTATDRKTGEGTSLNVKEAIARSSAISLYTQDPFSTRNRAIEEGSLADFVLVNADWLQEEDLRTDQQIVLTVKAGEITYDPGVLMRI